MTIVIELTAAFFTVWFVASLASRVIGLWRSPRRNRRTIPAAVVV